MVGTLPREQAFLHQQATNYSKSTELQVPGVYLLRNTPGSKAPWGPVTVGYGIQEASRNSMGSPGLCVRSYHIMPGWSSFTSSSGAAETMKKLAWGNTVVYEFYPNKAVTKVKRSFHGSQVLTTVLLPPCTVSIIHLQQFSSP